MAIQPEQTNNDPAVAAGQGVDLGALVANATMGFQRNPKVKLGTHVYTILGTNKPQIAMGFAADLVCDDDKQTYSYYKPLDGAPKKVKACTGEVLAFICAGAGFRNMKEFEEGGFTTAKRQVFVGRCLGAGPGPLEGRKIQITATDSGKMTTPKQKDDGTMGPSFPIHNYSFAPIDE
jgi:hypothetical protein